MDKKISKNFFIISFLPAIAYWYLEENYPIRIAIMGGLGLSILEMFLEKIFTGALHTLSKFNFGLILFLGCLSLMGDDGLWFKLQPAITGIVIGLFLLYKTVIKKNGLMLEMAATFQKDPPPKFLLEMLEKHVAILFFIYGLFMIFVATKLSTNHWVFFKTIGFYIVFLVFFVVELIYLRVVIKKKVANELKKEVLNSTSKKL